LIGFALKIILSIFSITLLLITFSCTDNDTIISPLQKDCTNQINKTGDIQFFISKIINGTVGGEILIDTTLVNEYGDLVRIEVLLRFDSLSFEGEKEITIIPNINDASIQFFPEINFYKKVKLQLIYTGIDLENLGFKSNSKVDFIFTGNRGDFESIDYSFCIINWHLQQLRVANAKLSHFSRYAFIKKSS
jgi:hypothetical protein